MNIKTKFIMKRGSSVYNVRNCIEVLKAYGGTSHISTRKFMKCSNANSVRRNFIIRLIWLGMSIEIILKSSNCKECENKTKCQYPFDKCDFKSLYKRLTMYICNILQPLIEHDTQKADLIISDQ